MGYAVCPIRPEVSGDGSGHERLALPVFNEDGELVYAVARRPHPFWAVYFSAFSVTGDTLLVGMLNHVGDGGELQVLRAADGELLRTIPLEYRPQYVTVDPVGPWIYLPAWIVKDGVHWLPTMMVVDRRTMEVVGTPTVPDDLELYGTADRGGGWGSFPAFVGDEAAYLSQHWHGSGIRATI